MPDTIRTKDELVAIMADNSTGDITPQDMRDFVVSNLVQKVQEESAPALLETHADFFLAKPGCTDLTLVPIDDYGNRSVQIANDSGGDLVITPDGAETINGQASISLADKSYVLLGAGEAGDWLVLVRTDDTQVEDYCLAYFNEAVSITDILSATYVDINENLVEGAKTDAFTVSSGEITYNGDDKTFAIDVSASAGKTMGSIELYTFAVTKNATPQVPTIGISLTNGVKDALPLQSVVSLSDGDTIKVQVRGDTTTDDLIVTDLTIRLTEI